MMAQHIILIFDGLIQLQSPPHMPLRFCPLINQRQTIEKRIILALYNYIYLADNSKLEYILISLL